MNSRRSAPWDSATATRAPHIQSYHSSIWHHEPLYARHVVGHHVVGEAGHAQLVADEAGDRDGLGADGHPDQGDVAEHARHDVNHLTHGHQGILKRKKVA